MAARVDGLFFFLLAVSLFFAALIFLLVAIFAVRYRRRPATEQPAPVKGNLKLEILWTVVPLSLTLVMFAWGVELYLDMHAAPDHAIEVNVVGKQWMWKVQHPTGQQEINELHVPVDRPVKLIMTSEDVIHDFFVPAFRVKQDVLPGRYTTLWFEATRPGSYRLFCSQYCGTQHAGMIGRVIVMDLVEYQKWLGGGSGVSMAEAGGQLFQRFGCAVCHRMDGTGQGPSLAGLFGKTVKLQGGKTAAVDERYIRESIVEPRAQLAAGYPAVMPTFKGLVSEEGILQIIAYLKSLGAEEGKPLRR